jgi:hypothetical protein
MKLMEMKGALLVLSTLALAACGNPNSMNQAADQTGIVSSDANSGIIGGKEIAESDPISKTVVAIYDTEQKTLCTGSIVAPDLVVTAGHCFNEDPTKLVLIFGTKLPTGNEDKPVVRRVVDGRLNPRFSQVVEMFNKNPKLDPDSVKEWGDISIVKFAGGLPAGYRASELLKDPKVLKTGMVVTLAGYGEIDGPRHIGSDSLRKVDVRIADANYSPTEVQMDQRDGRGACHGDSGGPAYVKVGNKTMLFGVTSRGNKDPKNDCSQYSIYTDAAAQMKFLSDSAKELNSTKPARAVAGK